MSPTPCCLLIDPPGGGAWNMGVDECLLDSFAQGETCCWRFYQWREPTLSLGYFQAYEDRQKHRPSRDCPAVRRASGGGAIVHDVELTYSLVAAASNPLARQPHFLYEAVHAALIEALVELGVGRASLFGQTGGLAEAKQPFLCFQRRSPGDVVYGEAKIAGSAQRRRRGAVLQHGSVLLGRSAAAPELPGIAELTGQDVACDTLITAWLGRLEVHLELAFSRQVLTGDQRRLAQQYAEEKYASDAWTRDRHAPPD